MSVMYSNDDVDFLRDEVKRLRAENKTLQYTVDQGAKDCAEIARLREALRIVDYTNRSRGYPTPKEWAEVVKVCKEAWEKKP